MKLGVSYSVFDGEELLSASIRSIRNNVDFINIMYQDKSYFGNEYTVEMKDLLSDLKRNKVVDHISRFACNYKKTPHQNEFHKRSMGLGLLKRNFCTHFMLMDSDEYYKNAQMKKAKDFILKEKFDSTACEILCYYKKPIYRFKYKKHKHYVPFICKLNLFSKLNYNCEFPVLVDSTRKIKCKNFYLFPHADLCMHHMNLVRKNIANKFLNTSARYGYAYKEKDIENYTKYYNNWNPRKPILYYPSDINKVDITKKKSEVLEVANEFNIDWDL